MRGAEVFVTYSDAAGAFGMLESFTSGLLLSNSDGSFTCSASHLRPRDGARPNPRVARGPWPPPRRALNTRLGAPPQAAICPATSPSCTSSVSGPTSPASPVPPGNDRLRFSPANRRRTAGDPRSGGAVARGRRTWPPSSSSCQWAVASSPTRVALERGRSLGCRDRGWVSSWSRCGGAKSAPCAGPTSTRGPPATDPPRLPADRRVPPAFPRLDAHVGSDKGGIC